MKRFRSTVLAAALSTVVTTVATLVPVAPASALPAWQDRATSWTNPAAKAPQVRDLRYATHPRFDRVVLDIKGRIPSGRARYQRRFHEDGSGHLVPIRGRSGIALALMPAYAHNANGDNVYDGPRIARPRFDTLKALAFTGDFEGQVSFGFALTHRAQYRVFWLHDPQRLVIDFRHAR
jgi:hypothetical protein